MPAGWRCRAASSRSGEDIEAAAYRELEEEAGVGPEDVVLEQLRTYGRPDRDPRGRVVTVAWLAMGANLPDPSAGSDAAEAMWVPVDEALAGGESLAFDHEDILRDGVERARAKLEYSGLGAAFCGAEFTVAELRCGLRGGVGATAGQGELPPEGDRRGGVPAADGGVHA